MFNGRVVINYNDELVNKAKFSSLQKDFSLCAIHSVINSILRWNAEAKYFLSYQILMFFNISNKNRLKNLVSKSIDDELVILELKKMIDSNFIDIASEEVVYEVAAILII